MGQRISGAITELETVAEANGIVVDLSTSGFGESGQAPGEPVQVQVPRRTVVEPADPLRPPGVPTEIAEVDAVIEAVLSFSGDFSAINVLIRYTTTGCTQQLGVGPQHSDRSWTEAGRQAIWDTDGVFVPVGPQYSNRLWTESGRHAIWDTDGVFVPVGHENSVRGQAAQS